LILKVIETGHLGVIVINYLQYMIEQKYELDLVPMVQNRSIVQLIPTKLFADWYHYVSPCGIKYSIDKLEPISFLIDDFDTRIEFNDWLESNFKLLFDIRLSYSCTDKNQWPENRTLAVFKSWFEIIHSNLILDLLNEPIKMI
jgi:hypothetical protein